MIELVFLRPVVRWLGIGWRVGFTRQKDSYPTAEYRCPFCNQCTPWVSGKNGFNGMAPVPTCCKAAVPYPDEASFVEHLGAKPRLSDGKDTPQRIIDTDEGGSTGNTGYVRGNPAVIMR